MRADLLGRIPEKMLNIIVNPRSLKKKGKNLLVKVEKRLRERGVQFHIHYSERAGQIRDYARCLSRAGERTFVAFGGDGTLNELLNGLECPEECVLGVIPAGTGNDFACQARIPKGIKSLDLILETEPKPTDFIQFDDGKRSMNIAGLGIDVDILKRCEKKKHGGQRSKYFFSLLASLRYYKPIPIEVTADGETKTYQALIACICNGSQFGGGIPICPGAEIDDGKLDLLVAECPKRSRIPIELIHLMRGKLPTRKIAHRVKCSEARIVALGETLAQYDGELMPCDALNAKIVAGKLKMFRG